MVVRAVASEGEFFAAAGGGPMALSCWNIPVSLGCQNSGQMIQQCSKFSTNAALCGDSSMWKWKGFVRRSWVDPRVGLWNCLAYVLVALLHVYIHPAQRSTPSHIDP
jgi:hypothetical protein